MGMDVHGKKPADERGVCFRASVWEWHPINEAIKHCCSDLLDKETLVGMSSNWGAGIDDQPTCNEIARRLEKLLETDDWCFKVDSALQVDAWGFYLTDGEVETLPPDQVRSPFRAKTELVREFCDFLRHCGGFEVW